MIPQNVSDRFWAKVEKAGEQECWPWRGAKGPNGYGRMQYLKRGETIYAHRLSLLIAGYSQPLNAVAMHVCDNPNCVNPAHLMWGTQSENMRQSIDSGRSPHKGRVAGEKNGNAKLTAEKVLTIRASNEAQRVVAERYGITRTLVSQIRLRQAWAHVP